MEKKRLVVVIMISILGLCLSFPIFAETIVLKSGKNIEGKIIERTDKYIKIDFEGVPLTYFLDEIESIDKEKIEKRQSQIFDEITSCLVVITSDVSFDTLLGSGFIVDKSGVIITNFHNIVGAKKTDVRLHDGRTYPIAGVIGYDIKQDICVFKIDANDLPFLYLGNSDDLKPGQKVLAIGTPPVLKYNTSEGTFNGYKQVYGGEYLIFTAVVSPGFSGGPLLDMEGRVIGVTTAFLLGSSNVNSYAIPINKVKHIIHTSSKITNINELNTPENKAYPFLYKGANAYYSSEFNLALDFLQQAISINPNIEEAYLFRGMVYYQKGLFDKAIADFNKAIEINPQNSMAYYNRGMAHKNKDLYRQSISDFNEAIKIDPSNAEAYFSMGSSYFSLEEYQKAITYLEKSLEVNPNNSKPLRLIAGCHGFLNQNQEALIYCQKAIEIDPNDPENYLALGTAYYSLGKYQEAKEQWLKAIELFKIKGDYKSIKFVEDYIKKIP